MIRSDDLRADPLLLSSWSALKQEITDLQIEDSKYSDLIAANTAQLATNSALIADNSDEITLNSESIVSHGLFIDELFEDSFGTTEVDLQVDVTLNHDRNRYYNVITYNIAPMKKLVLFSPVKEGRKIIVKNLNSYSFVLFFANALHVQANVYYVVRGFEAHEFVSNGSKWMMITPRVDRTYGFGSVTGTMTISVVGAATWLGYPNGLNGNEILLRTFDAVYQRRSDGIYGAIFDMSVRVNIGSSYNWIIATVEGTSLISGGPSFAEKIFSAEKFEGMSSCPRRVLVSGYGSCSESGFLGGVRKFRVYFARGAGNVVSTIYIEGGQCVLRFEQFETINYSNVVST